MWGLFNGIKWLLTNRESFTDTIRRGHHCDHAPLHPVIISVPLSFNDGRLSLVKTVSHYGRVPSSALMVTLECDAADTADAIFYASLMNSPLKWPWVFKGVDWRGGEIVFGTSVRDESCKSSAPAWLPCFLRWLQDKGNQPVSFKCH